MQIFFEKRFAKIKVGEGAFGEFEVFNGVGEMAKEVLGDGEFEMPALADGGILIGLDFLLQRLGRFAQSTILGFPLSQAAAQFLHRAGVAILSFDHQRLQVNQDRVHHLERTSHEWIRLQFEKVNIIV